MQGYNVLIVFNHDKGKLLMCRRKKEPYKGRSNFIGGKIELNEDGVDAAYRELYEESGIAPSDIKLTHLMTFTYNVHDLYIEAYVGKLNKELVVNGDENELYWSELDRDFFDMKLFAGEGNIGHMLEQVKIHEDQLL